jgi:hypothetical protein
MHVTLFTEGQKAQLGSSLLVSRLKDRSDVSNSGKLFQLLVWHDRRYVKQYHGDFMHTEPGQASQSEVEHCEHLAPYLTW